jgi:hypothetical protein
MTTNDVKLNCDPGIISNETRGQKLQRLCDEQGLRLRESDAGKKNFGFTPAIGAKSEDVIDCLIHLLEHSDDPNYSTLIYSTK